jgi:hypothetical protein
VTTILFNSVLPIYYRVGWIDHYPKTVSLPRLTPIILSFSSSKGSTSIMGAKTQVRKTSVSERKKSQRLILNPPKPQKLIIRGPQHPVEKPQKLKIRLSREPASVSATEPDQQFPINMHSAPIESGPALSESTTAAGELLSTPPESWLQPFNSSEPVETDLIGQGADATYNYSDICMVQAVAKAFNGTSSVTRYLDSVDDNNNPIPGFHLGDGVTKMESEDVYREKAELEMVCEMTRFSTKTQ